MRMHSEKSSKSIRFEPKGVAIRIEKDPGGFYLEMDNGKTVEASVESSVARVIDAIEAFVLVSV